MTDYGKLIEDLNRMAETAAKAARYIEWLESVLLHQPQGEPPIEEGDRANG